MEKEDIALLAQLFTALRDAAAKLEQAYNNNDMGGLGRAKKEILMLQAKIDRLT